MKTDVLVIGGGLAGCATAYFLAKEGVDVLLVERSDLNTQASGSNAGSIHAQIPHEPFVLNGDEWARIFAPTIPLFMAAIRLWSSLGEELDADLDVAITGGVLVADSEAQMRDVERKTAIERAHGLPVELLGRDELSKIAPYVSERMIGGSFCPVEGKANPLAATPAFARAAAARGARILRGTELHALERVKDGFRAETSAGPVSASRVVNCAGAEAGHVARMVGVDLPIEGHPIQVNVTEPAEKLVPHLVYYAGGKLTLKQMGNGTFLIGGGWPARIDAATGRLSADPQSVRDNLRVATAVVPLLAGIHLVRTWPAIVNGTADWKPIIGEVGRVPGFFLAMFPWMGFTAGPLAAQIVTALVLGRKPAHDMSLFSAERYG